MLEDFFQELIIQKLTEEFSQMESYLKSLLNERKNNLTEIDKLKKDHSGLEMKKTKLTELLAQSREAIVERDEKIRKLETVREEFERDLESAGMEYDEKCAQTNSLSSRVSQLEEENDNLLEKIKTGSLLVKQEKEYKVAELTVQLQGQEYQLTDLQEKLSTIEAELVSLREKCENQTEQIERKTKKIGSLEDQLGKFQNVNKKLLIRKRDYKKAESILKKDFELYKKKTKQKFERLQNEILLMKNAGLSGNSESKLLEEIGDSMNTTKTSEYRSYDNKKIEDYEESLKKIKSFKVPKLKPKEASSDDGKSAEIMKCGNRARAGFSNTLFIANLNYEITSSQLTEFLSPFGLEKIELPRRDLKKNKGCAWVTFKSGEEAGVAIKKTNKQYFHGRQLSVRWSNGKR